MSHQIPEKKPECPWCSRSEDVQLILASGSHPLNMAGWCVEKSNIVLRSLSRLVNQVRIYDSEDSAYVEMQDELGSAIYNATKLLAFSCGTNFNPSDASLIMREGFCGYRKIAIHYGAISDSELPNKQATAQFVEKISDYLAKKNRTLIADSLNQLKRDWITADGLHYRELEGIAKIADLTEQKAMGQLSWEEYEREVQVWLQLLLDWAREPSSPTLPAEHGADDGVGALF